jgi:hypothetical protein
MFAHCIVGKWHTIDELHEHNHIKHAHQTNRSGNAQIMQNDLHFFHEHNDSKHAHQTNTSGNA